MSERAGAVIHDGQADAMPCQCPACISPFITANRDRVAAPCREPIARARFDVARNSTVSA